MAFKIGPVGMTPSRKAGIISDEDLDIVYINDFDDGYHDDPQEIDEEASELEKRAKQIKHINKDPHTYLDSLECYDEYMHTLYVKYGAKEFFDLKLKNGLVKEYVPPFPELKVNSSNREVWNILKNGGNVSRRTSNSSIIDFEALNLYLERTKDLHGLDDVPDTPVEVELAEHPKWLQREIDKQLGYDKKREKKKKNKLYQNNSSLNDFFEEYYHGKKDEDEEPFMSLHDAWYNPEKYQEVLRYREEKANKKDLVRMSYNGIVRMVDEDEVNLMNALKRGGWDVKKCGHLFGADTIDRDKRDKKLKKKLKKKSSMKKKEFDKYLYDVTILNGTEEEDESVFKSFEDFEKSYLDFSADSILS